LGSDLIVCACRPLEAFVVALAATLRVCPMKMFWKASWVPEAAVRTTRSIGPLAVAPGTELQVRTRPEKTSWICVWLNVGIVFDALATTQTASRAILLNTIPPGSAGLGSR